MKKPILLILLTPLMLSACTGGSSSSRSREDDSSSTSSISSSSTSEDSSSVVVEPLISDLSENEYNKIPENYLNKLRKYNTYKSVTTGETVSHVMFFDVTQKIDVTVIKSEYSYMTNASDSSMYSSYHEAYYHNDKAAYKNKGDDNYTVSSLTDYLNKYGIYPFEHSIEGYKISGDAITSITKEGQEGDTYKFKIVFDKDKATNNVSIQMKEFGELDDYPVFDDIAITMTLKNDYTPIKLELESHYDAKKMVGTSCHQTYTVTFSDFNADIAVPNLEAIKALI